MTLLHGHVDLRAPSEGRFQSAGCPIKKAETNRRDLSRLKNQVTGEAEAAPETVLEQTKLQELLVQQGLLEQQQGRLEQQLELVLVEQPRR